MFPSTIVLQHGTESHDNDNFSPFTLNKLFGSPTLTLSMLLCTDLSSFPFIYIYIYIWRLWSDYDYFLHGIIITNDLFLAFLVNVICIFLKRHLVPGSMLFFVHCWKIIEKVTFWVFKLIVSHVITLNKWLVVCTWKKRRNLNSQTNDSHHKENSQCGKDHRHKAGLCNSKQHWLIKYIVKML